MHHRSMLSHVVFCFAAVADFVREFVTEGVLSKFLHTNNLVLVGEKLGLRNKFINLEVAFESEGLKINLGKIKVVVSWGITKDGLCKR